MRVNFQALGCRLNEAELDAWSREFGQRGHELTSDSQSADLVIFNSCSVTAEADRKSRQLINRVHRANPQAQLVVTGCYASLQSAEVEAHPGVDLVVDNTAKDRMVDSIVDRLGIDDANGEQAHSIFDRGRHRAFVKVQDGCRYRCTFCIVTIARGDERSRPAYEIINEINCQHALGVQEIVLTGVHVGGYGSELGTSLYELVSEILENTRIPRVRLASVEPWDLPGHFFDLFSEPRMMPHIHLPLQSGSDTVLRRMARRCKTTQYLDLLDAARSRNGSLNVTTDIIVGFPGETQAEWLRTVSFAREAGFGGMHIFTYSPRAGTKAAGLPDQVSSQVKKSRSAELHELDRDLRHKSMQAVVGEECEVLWEHPLKAQPQAWVGYTPHYHRVVSHQPDLRQSGISRVRLAGVNPEDNCLEGHFFNPNPSEQSIEHAGNHL